MMWDESIAQGYKTPAAGPNRKFMKECDEALTFLYETYRSRERKLYLYAQGRTRPAIKLHGL